MGDTNKSNLRNPVTNLPGNKDKSNKYKMVPHDKKKGGKGAILYLTNQDIQKPEIKRARGNAYILDTNILIYNPSCIHNFVETGNTVIIPNQVIEELDVLKNENDTRLDAREASHIIEYYRSRKSKKVLIHFDLDFSRRLRRLKKTNPDHVIIAQANDFYKKNKSKFSSIKLLSQDTLMRTVAREMLRNLKIEEEYKNDKTEEKKLEIPIQQIDVPFDEIFEENGIFYFPVTTKNERNIKQRQTIPLNSGVICKSNWDEERKTEKWKDSFVALRKQNRFRIIPKNISAFNIGPYNINKSDTGAEFKASDNWGQAIALAQLLDPEIACVFLEGAAGTGKTMLALAAFIEQHKNYKQIMVTRPAVHLEDKDTIGFLPGDKKEKMNSWLAPIWMNLNYLKEKEPKKANCASKKKGLRKNKEESEEKPTDNSVVTEMLNKGKILIESLDYIRGQTLPRIGLLVDESQNLTPHQIKTIITRIGKGGKIVFTGDLGQVDLRKKLDRTSNGLSYAMTRMNNHPLVAVISLPDGVRSELANLAEERLQKK